LILQAICKMVMAKCSKCGADITSTGYDTEELRLPNEATGYLVSCKQCKTILGIVQEK
jgi:hypothetical protein